MNESHHDDHWLARPATIKLLWRVFAAVLVLLVLAQAVIYVKGYFGVDGWLGFGALFGFLDQPACLLRSFSKGAFSLLVDLRRDRVGDGRS